MTPGAAGATDATDADDVTGDEADAVVLRDARPRPTSAIAPSPRPPRPQPDRARPRQTNGRVAPARGRPSCCQPSSYMAGVGADPDQRLGRFWRVTLQERERVFALRNRRRSRDALHRGDELAALRERLGRDAPRPIDADLRRRREGGARFERERHLTRGREALLGLRASPRKRERVERRRQARRDAARRRDHPAEHFREDATSSPSKRRCPVEHLPEHDRGRVDVDCAR